MKVSIVVPCFNMKMHLEECLDSILSQSLEEIEVICIDDGSSDGTKELLENYHSKYEKIYFLSQENKGSGMARNLGIKLAQGEYIAFMDADDFYPNTNILEYLYKMAMAKKANICGGSFCSYRNGVYTYDGFRQGMVFKEDSWISKEEFPVYGGYTRFLYNREFLISNNIFFPDYLRGQDPPFFVKALSKAEKAYCLKEITYCYRKEYKQVKFNEKMAIDYIRGIKDCFNISKKEKLSGIYKTLLNELHGEPTALMYYFAYGGSTEMKNLIHDINVIVQEGNGKNNLNRQLLLEGDALDKYYEIVWREHDKFFAEIEQYSKILIFGAGTVGRKVLNFLRDNHYEPDSFIVSDLKQNPDEVEGVSVRTIDEYVHIQDKCFIIVATFSYLHKEIKEVLYKKGIKKLYLIDMEKLYLWRGGIVH